MTCKFRMIKLLKTSNGKDISGRRSAQREVDHNIMVNVNAANCFRLFTLVLIHTKIMKNYSPKTVDHNMPHFSEPCLPAMPIQSLSLLHIPDTDSILISPAPSRHIHWQDR